MYPERKQTKKLKRKPERKDLSLRSETVRKSWRHSLLAGVSLLQHEIQAARIQQEKKVWE